MNRTLAPFSLPRALDPDLTRIHVYWESLKRGDNNIPFWDDFKTSALQDISDKIMLIDVQEKPERFRINSFGVGEQLTNRYGEPIGGKFLDEIELKNPLEYLATQCSATIEGRAPTYHQHRAEVAHGLPASVSYSRILLPMWGDGKIGMLLCGFEWA